MQSLREFSKKSMFFVVQLVSKLFISVHVRIYTMVQIKKIWPVAKA